MQSYCHLLSKDKYIYYIVCILLQRRILHCLDLMLLEVCKPVHVAMHLTCSNVTISTWKTNRGVSDTTSDFAPNVAIEYLPAAAQ